jgi:hypothetical protein
LKITVKNIDFSESLDTIGKWGSIPLDIDKLLKNTVATTPGKPVLIKVIGTILIITEEENSYDGRSQHECPDNGAGESGRTADITDRKTDQ